MSIVYVTNVTVHKNPAPVSAPLELEVSFESLEALQEDLEWRLVYVGDADDKSKDQELECVALGPIQRGVLRFVLVADAPDYSRLNKEDICGITIIFLSASYRHQEFVRIGWYLHNYVSDPSLQDADVDLVPLDRLLAGMTRVILAENPRVTRFNITWDQPDLQMDPMVMGAPAHLGFAPSGEAIDSSRVTSERGVTDAPQAKVPDTAAPTPPLGSLPANMSEWSVPNGFLPTSSGIPSSPWAHPAPTLGSSRSEGALRADYGVVKGDIWRYKQNENTMPSYSATAAGSDDVMMQ